MSDPKRENFTQKTDFQKMALERLDKFIGQNGKKILAVQEHETTWDKRKGKEILIEILVEHPDDPIRIFLYIDEAGIEVGQRYYPFEKWDYQNTEDLLEKYEKCLMDIFKGDYDKAKRYCSFWIVAGKRDQTRNNQGRE